jgi:hypothetical protein
MGFSLNNFPEVLDFYTFVAKVPQYLPYNSSIKTAGYKTQLGVVES